MQSTEGKTQVIRQAGGVGCKNVYLQYQHSIFHPTDKYYNAEQNAVSLYVDMKSSFTPPSQFY